MITIAYIIFKLESMIKKQIVGNHTFFAVVTINFFAYINSIVTVFKISILQNYFRQDNLSFVCLESHKYNCLNILASNICMFLF